MKYTGALAGGAHTERKENMVEKTLKISARKGGKRRVGFLSSVVGAVKSAFWTVIDAFQRFFKFLWSKSKFTKAAFFLVLALFIVGACTIGGFNGGGSAYLAEEGSTVAFYLDYQDGATLDKVYLNAGTAYAETGTSFTVTVRTSSNSSLSWITSYGFGAKKISNIYSSDAEALGTNYDWVQLRDESNTTALSTSRRLVQLEFSCPVLVNEVVFVDTNGNVIPAYVEADDVRELLGEEQWVTWGTTFRAQSGNEGLANLLDAQQNVETGNTVYSDFTEDEMYTLMQIENIVELGSRVPDGGVFNADTDYGAFAVLPYVLSTLIFGRSAFGLRIVSVLFTAALVWMIWLLARELFAHGDKEKEGWAFLTACLFAGGGLALTVGRLGLYLPMLAFLIVGSFYFMYRFFARGISEERPAKSACNILVSGLLFALAVASDPKMLLAGVGVVALFIAGAVRLERAYKAKRQALRAEMRDANAKETSREVMLENAAAAEEKSAALGAELSYARRLVYLLFFVSFAVGTFLFIVLSAIPSNSIFMRLYEANPRSPALGIFDYLGSMFGGAFSLTNATSLAAGNAVNAFGWFVGLKGATLFSASAEGTYSALNAQVNLAMAITALVGFLFLTAYTVLYYITGGQKGAYASKHAPTVLRAYFVLLAGLVSSLLPYLFAGQVSAAQSMLFNCFYLAFIPLTFFTVSAQDTRERAKLFGCIRMNTAKWVLFWLLVLYAVIFVLSVPMYFGIPLSAAAAAGMFGWTTFMNNGLYR